MGKRTACENLGKAQTWPVCNGTRICVSKVTDTATREPCSEISKSVTNFVALVPMSEGRKSSVLQCQTSDQYGVK